MEEEVENLALHYEVFGGGMPPLLFDGKMLLDQRAFRPVGFA